MNEKWKNLDTSAMLKSVFWLFALVFLAAAIISPDRAEMLSGLKAIYTTPAQVTKDYFAVGSVSATFAKTSLPQGIYLLRIQSKTGKRATIKLIK